MVIKGIDGGMGISGISLPSPSGAAGGNRTTGVGEGFTNVLGDMVKEVNNLQNKADMAVQKLATGESKGLHEVMIAMEKSNISFQFLSQVRNKAVEAYHEILRMQV
jgi:flagellar hook-basal body complex protein FliE